MCGGLDGVACGVSVVVYKFGRGSMRAGDWSDDVCAGYRQPWSAIMWSRGQMHAADTDEGREARGSESCQELILLGRRR
jgi:hypothetical protein